VRDISADDVKTAEFVNNPLIVADVDAEDDNEGEFEAVALFVSAEEGDTKGLNGTDEVKEATTEFVCTADIDDAIVFEDVSDPSSTVEDGIDVELAE